MHRCLNNGTFFGSTPVKGNGLLQYFHAMYEYTPFIMITVLSEGSIVPLTTQLAFINKSAVLNTKRVHSI